MALQHQVCFYRFASGLETSLEIYLDHKSDLNFAKLVEAIDRLARRDAGINILGNGFYMSQAPRNSLDIDVSSLMLEDHDDFANQYNPIIDEMALMPSKIALVRNLFGNSARS